MVIESEGEVVWFALGDDVRVVRGEMAAVLQFDKFVERWQDSTFVLCALDFRHYEVCICTHNSLTEGGG